MANSLKRGEDREYLMATVPVMKGVPFLARGRIRRPPETMLSQVFQVLRRPARGDRLTRHGRTLHVGRGQAQP